MKMYGSLAKCKVQVNVFTDFCFLTIMLRDHPTAYSFCAAPIYVIILAFLELVTKTLYILLLRVCCFLNWKHYCLISFFKFWRFRYPNLFSVSQFADNFLELSSRMCGQNSYFLLSIFEAPPTQCFHIYPQDRYCFWHSLMICQTLFAAWLLNERNLSMPRVPV